MPDAPRASQVAPAKVWERPDRKGFSSGCRNADFLGGFQLLTRQTIIPFKEFLQSAAVVEVIEERLHRHARAFEDHRAAHHFRMLRENRRQMVLSNHS